LNFSLYAYRFEFQARETVRFAPGSAANAFRGAFGHLLRRIACRPECDGPKTCSWRQQCVYARLFEPSWQEGPSGFADAPRPFVIRAAALDGCRFQQGALFPIDVHVFDVAEPVLEYLVMVFLRLATEGIGAGRGRIDLRRVHALGADGKPSACVYEEGRGTDSSRRDLIQLPLLSDDSAPVQTATIRFQTPTELKSRGEVLRSAPFWAVFARARDRVATLASLYTDSLVELDIDFHGMARRAAAVRTVRSGLRWLDASRRSSRTGQVHPLGGFVGDVEYEGELAEFLPILRAAYWTGVGRQTVWGKGVVEVTATANPALPVDAA
jgi:hypothetical protein